MRVCVLDAWCPKDPALVNSHWVAVQTRTALDRSVPGCTTHFVERDDVDRARIEFELSNDHDGFVYCGHGRNAVLYRLLDAEEKPIPLFGMAHLATIGRRWFHAFACMSGLSLCVTAPREGVGAYVGYNVAVVLEWEASGLPTTLVAPLAELVTAATLRLARGERSRSRVRRAVQNAAKHLFTWVRDNPSKWRGLKPVERNGIQQLAGLLDRDMAMEGLDVTE